MKTQRRPQRQKSSKVQQVQELRRSSAASPHVSATEYKRHPKHGFDFMDETDDNYNPYLWR
jgi:hypothetical protein